MPHAFESSFEIHELLNESGWLRGLAASLVADPAQADDLVQDTWLASLRHPPRADGDARPWLTRVVHNLARNARRANARREAREDFAFEERAEPTPAVLAQVAEAQRLLAEAVTRLPDGLRAVVVLCYFQGLDSRAAGERLGLSASAVRTRLQAALAALRADLDRRSGGREAWAGMLAGLARTDTGNTLAASGASALLGSWSLVLVAGAAALGLALVVVARDRSNDDGGFALSPSSASDSALAAEPARAAEAELQAGTREALALEASAQPATATAATATAQVAGTIRVDGRPPEWPLVVSLTPTLPPADKDGRRARVRRIELELTPEQRGAFAFDDLASDWSGTLRVEDHTFANGEEALEIAAPRTGLVLELRSGPTIVGRLLDPEGRPCHGLEAWCELQIGRTDEDPHDVTTTSFGCRDDGRFRIPCLPTGDWGAVILRVEAGSVGFLHCESPRFVPAAGHDLGELQLEPVRALTFRVLDPRGRPIAGVVARVDGVPWSSESAPTDAEGRGVLAFAPDRSVDVRFHVMPYADRVVTVAAARELEIELEPLAGLEIELAGANRNRVREILLWSERPAFVWDASDWSERPSAPEERATARIAPAATPGGGAARARAQSGSSVPSVRRRPAAPDQRYEYEFAPSDEGRLSLIGLVPDVALVLELRDAEQRLLSVATISVAAQEWAELEILVP